MHEAQREVGGVGQLGCLYFLWFQEEIRAMFSLNVYVLFLYVLHTKDRASLCSTKVLSVNSKKRKTFKVKNLSIVHHNFCSSLKSEVAALWEKGYFYNHEKIECFFRVQIKVALPQTFCSGIVFFNISYHFRI